MTQLRIALLTFVLAWTFTAGGVHARQLSKSVLLDHWVNAGVEGGRVQAIAVDPQTPTTLYAAMGLGGVYKSIDGGATWVVRNSGFAYNAITYPNVSSIIVDPLTPTTVYAAGGNGVFKSTNGGAYWARLSGVYGMVLAIDPSQPATIYAAGLDRVYKTTDGGAAWTWMNWSAPSTIEALVIDPAVPTRLYVGTRFNGVFKSVDGGFTWASFSSGLEEAHPTYPLSGLNVYSLAASTSGRGTIYAGTANGIFRSINWGGTWQKFSGGWDFSEISSITVDPSSPYTLYLGTNGGVFKTTDSGYTWKMLTGTWYDPESHRSGTNAVAINPQNPAIIYAGLDGAGVIKSADGGATWTTRNTGLTAAQVTDIAIDPVTPTTLYAVVGGGGIAKSTNGGTIWTAMNTVETGLTTNEVVSIAIDPQTPETLYLGTSFQGVFKSTDGGATWHHTNSAGSLLWGVGVWGLVIDPIVPTTLYAGTSRGVFKSIDGGASWTARNAGLPANGPANIVVALDLAIDPANPGTLYVNARQSTAGLFKSIDGAASWSASSSGLLPDQGITSIAIDPRVTSTLYVGMGTGGSSGGLFTSTDGGASWTGNSTPFTGVAQSVSSLAIDPTQPATIYASHYREVYKSTDGGATLHPTRPLNAWVNTLAFNPQSGTVFAGTVAGMFRYRPLQLKLLPWGPLP